jgi:hypothetical protein
MKSLKLYSAAAVLSTALISTAALASTWTCQGVCGYAADPGYPSTQKPATIATGNGDTSASAYADATSQCTLPADADATKYTKLILVPFANARGSVDYMPGTVTSACVKN